MTKTKALATTASPEAVEELRKAFPVDKESLRIMLPRLSMVSQDVVEGKGKAMKVITEAGTFIEERQTDETDENDKKIWEKIELGTSIEATILYQRRQLKFYDGSSFVSSPIYDTDDEILPLFKDKQEIDRGTPKELKSRKEYEGKSAKGKDISKLDETKVLYVLYKNELYQMNIRGTSMYAFKKYVREVTVPAVLTSLGSEPKENGSIAWNQMTFKKVRDLDSKEVEMVKAHMQRIAQAIAIEKEQYAEKKLENKKGDDELDNMVKDAQKKLD